MFDTNVAIRLRDVDPAVVERFRDLDALPLISIVSRIELENGVRRGPESPPVRRRLLDELLMRLKVLPFGDAEASAYRRIIANVTVSRRKIIDRMIAATALVHGHTLVSTNAADFRDIPGLHLEAW